MQRISRVVSHLHPLSSSSNSEHLSDQIKDLSAYFDHTILKPGTTDQDVKKICSEAQQYGFAAICVTSSWISLAVSLLKIHNEQAKIKRTRPVKICSVVGFPLGSIPTKYKVQETKEAIDNGANEIDMVLNIDRLKQGDVAYVLDDIRQVVEICRKHNKGEKVCLKVILETSLLTVEEKKTACKLSIEAKADYVKTSTGVYGNATVEDVQLLSSIVKSAGLGVKASGGIRTLDFALKLITAGATRIGASASVDIVKAFQKEKSSVLSSHDAPSILVVGSSNMDLISYVHTLPKPGETLMGTKFQTGYGGKGANQAVMAARLGGRVTFLTKVGSDSFGKEMLENYKQQGIATHHVNISTGTSGIAPIWVDSHGENSIIVIPGANFELTKEEIHKAKEDFKKAKILLVQNELPIQVTLEALKLGRSAGITTFFNVAPAPQDASETSFPSEIYSVTDILCVNETELGTLSGLPTKDVSSMKVAAKKLLERGLKHVIVTMGANGCLLLSSDNTTGSHIPAVRLKKEQVIDTVGAGDCFSGSFGYFFAQGKSLSDAIQKANAVAALSVQKKGTQSSYPYRKDIPSNILE